MFKVRRDSPANAENGHGEYERLINGQRQSLSYSATNTQSADPGKMDLQRVESTPDALVISSSSFSRKRLVGKDGELLIRTRNVHRKSELYFTDLFTTLVDLSWGRIFFIFCFVYVFSWTFFASLYYVINAVRSPSNCCVEEVNTWVDAFLFSIETQMTIGYGGRQITPRCPDGIIILQFQSILSMAEDAFLIGLMFCKLSRPQIRAMTIKFSRHACITLRNGKMCFMFRIADIRKSQLIEAHIRLQLFHHSKTKEGYECDFYQEDLKVGYDWRQQRIDDDDNRNQLFLLLPMIIIHVIDETSPLYNITPEQLRNSDFEFIPVLDGIVEATGMNTQARTSYLGEEVLWGRDFKNVVSRSYHDGEIFWADFSDFENTIEAPCPMVSPKEYYNSEGYKGSDSDSDDEACSFGGENIEPIEKNLQITKL